MFMLVSDRLWFKVLIEEAQGALPGQLGALGQAATGTKAMRDVVHMRLNPVTELVDQAIPARRSISGS